MLLIFPGGMPSALERLSCVEDGEVVGASMLHGDAAAALYPRWEFLPRYDDPAFGEMLQAVLRRHGITRIHCPHTVVWRRLAAVLPTLAADVALENSAPFVEEIASYRGLFRRLDAAQGAGFPLAAAGSPAPAPTAAEIRGYIHLARSVPGLSSEEKLLAVAEAMRHCPQGDLVEVGSWWGKSAVALGWLARRYGVGKLLCVDPWSQEEARQASEDVNEETARWDMDEVLRVFETNLAMLGGEANYLRATSREGAAHYAAGLPVESEAFGQTRYAGQIALIHIDGNHELEHVREDVAVWAPHVAPGGWVVLDDYVWPFGDGPKQVGDSLLAEWAGAVACSFVSGGALFIQRRLAQR